MGTSILTDIIKDPGGNVVATSPGTQVNFRLCVNGSPTPGYRISDGVNVASLIVTSASTTGTISQALENNSNIAPGGTYYIAEILCPSSQGGTQEWALLSSSSVSPQTFHDALAFPIPTFVPLSTIPTSILTGNNTFTGINQFNGNVYFKSGYPWVDVKAYGAAGDGTTDDTAAITAAIAGLPSPGGIVFFPPGTYVISSTITITDSNVHLMGVGMIPGQPGLGIGKGTVIRWNGVDLGTMFEVKNTSSSPYGVSFQDMVICGEITTNDLVPKAAIGIAYRAGYGHYLRNVHIFRCKGSATQGALTLGNDSGASDPAVGTIQNFRSENLWVTLYGNSNAVGILVNHSGTEICAFDTTHITCGANSAGQGNGTMLHALWLQKAPSCFDSLITDTNAAQGVTASIQVESGGEVLIDGWTSEDSIPIAFASGQRLRGSTISNADLRSCDVTGGAYGIEFNGGSGLNSVQSLQLNGVTVRRRTDAVNRPSIRVNNGVVQANGVEFFEKVSDAVMNSASPTLTSATFTFDANDVGANVLVSGAGVAGADLTSTILAYTNPTTVTLANNASTSVTGATLTVTVIRNRANVTTTGTFMDLGTTPFFSGGVRVGNSFAVSAYLGDGLTPCNIASISNSSNLQFGSPTDQLDKTIFYGGLGRKDFDFGAADITGVRMLLPTSSGLTTLQTVVDESTGVLQKIRLGAAGTGPGGVGRMMYTT